VEGTFISSDIPVVLGTYNNMVEGRQSTLYHLMEGTLFASSNRYYLFQEPIVIFQVPSCNKNKGLSNAETHIILFRFS